MPDAPLVVAAGEPVEAGVVAACFALPVLVAPAAVLVEAAATTRLMARAFCKPLAPQALLGLFQIVCEKKSNDKGLKSKGSNQDDCNAKRYNEGEDEDPEGVDFF